MKDMKNIQNLADALAQIQTVPARTTTMSAVTFQPERGIQVVFMRERPALDNMRSVERISEVTQQRISGIQ